MSTARTKGRATGEAARSAEEATMAIDLYENHFSTEEEALKEIEAGGLWPLSMEFPAEEVGAHWHNFDASVYMVEGTLRLTDPTNGVTHVVGAGTKVVVPARTLHAEKHDGFKAVLGLSVDPSTLEQPINLPPEEL